MNHTFTPVSELAAKFSDQYETHAQADSFLNQLVLRSDRLKTTVNRFEARELNDESTFQRKKKELVEVVDHLDFLQQSVATLQTPKLVTQYKKELYEEKERKAKLELWMENHNPNNDNLAYLNYEAAKADLEYTTAIATALCEWFATGAAGPGTLTFNGKSYTAS